MGLLQFKLFRTQIFQSGKELQLVFNHLIYGYSFLLLLTPSHSFSLLLTPSHSFSLLLTPTHSYSLLLRQVDENFLRQLLFEAGVLISDSKLSQIFRTMQSEIRTQEKAISLEDFKAYILKWKPLGVSEKRAWVFRKQISTVGLWMNLIGEKPTHHHLPLSSPPPPPPPPPQPWVVGLFSSAPTTSGATLTRTIEVIGRRRASPTSKKA
jgi:hypothetical protein